MRPAVLKTACLWLFLQAVAGGQAVAAQPADDDRRVWEYTGSYGPSWFVHEGNRKWVLYRGDGRTYLYVEEGRDKDAIELRGPHTKLWMRLSADRFETRRSPDEAWRRSAGGKWVDASRLPERIRNAPDGYQVRIVYFVPTDREPATSHAPKIRLIMSLVAELIHDDLRSKGHRHRLLEFESRDGETVVHLLRGAKPAAHYHADWNSDPQAQMTRIHDEVLASFGDAERHLTVVFAETYTEAPTAEGWFGHIARGTAKPPEGGFAVYSSWILKDDFSALDRDAQQQLFFDRTPIAGRKAFGSRVPDSPRYEFVEDAFGAVLHELGHALGLPHDYRSPRDIMGSGFRELRWNLDGRSPTNRRVSFSADNARMLMSSRYLAEDLNLEDYDPPTVELELTRRGRALEASVRAADETGLRAVLFYDRTKQASSVVEGRRLAGKQQEFKQLLPPELLEPGRMPKIEIFVSDDGGNVTRVTATLDEAQ
jgi:hypothetical protein